MAYKSTSKSFPGFSSIYYFSDKGTGNPFHASVEVETTQEAFGLTRAEIRPTSPVQARWFMGRKKPTDVIGATYAVILLVSERVVNMLQDAGFTGWSTYDVNLLGHDGMPIPGYYGFAVCGRCGPIDESKAVEIPRICPGGVFPGWFGMYFDPDTWDGSDIFMPDHPLGAIFLTEDVKRAFEKAKIKNVRFTPLDEARVIKLRNPPPANAT